MKPAGTGAAGPARIRHLNRQAVLNQLRLGGAVSRTELAASLGLSPAGVSAVVNDLLAAGLIRPASGQAALATSRRGRPMAPLELNPEAACAIGLRLRPVGRRLIVQAASIDYAGRVEVLAPLAGALPATVDDLLASVSESLNQALATLPGTRPVLGCAIAVPGVVVDGSVRLAPSLPVLEGDDCARRLASELAVPALIQNDVNLSVLSELHTQSRLRNKSFAYLYIGAGVGAGIALQGRLWAASGWAGEVGHIRIDRGGTRASFEELLATDRNLADALAGIGLAADDLEAFAAEVQAGSAPAVAVLEAYAATLAELVQILNAVLDLDEVIIDFPSPSLFARIRPVLERRIRQQLRPLVVSLPTGGDEAALRGAALAALESATVSIENE